MAKIRVHELAKELERENKEIIAMLQKLGVEAKSHMSAVEDEDAEKLRAQFAPKKTVKSAEEDDAKESAKAAKATTPKKAEETETGPKEAAAVSGPEKKAEANQDSVEDAPAAPPKKKNIIQVFRPQNSKTGMVKPGGRPRPQGQGGMRPQGQPGMRPQGQGGMRPQGQPGMRPQGQPGMRPQGQGGMRPQGQPGMRPQGQGGMRTQGQPGTRPQDAQARPVSAQEARPQGQGGTRPQSQPGTRSQGQGSIRPQGQPSARPQGQGGMRPQGQTGARPQGQGGRYQGDGQGRSQGGRFGGDGQGRGQGGRFGGDGQNRGSGRGQSGRPSGIPKPQTDGKPMEKESRKRTERGDRNRDRGDKFDRLEKNARQNQKGGMKKGQQPKAPAQKPVEKPEDTIRTITIPEKLTISELAEAMKTPASAVVKKLFLQGTMVTVNEEVDFDKAEEIALEFNCICEKEVKVNVIEELLKEEEDAEETLVPRSPVVCVMGHVDHGKTSLLDAIRDTHVIDKEAGGITQHIGAYVVSVNGQKITFLDTPGHEAFTAMRMRGANATDIAILVVAADDGVMPQTIEAISHAKAAGIEIIVAINKIDKPSANVERVKQELSEYELVPEDWGGNTVFVPVSAHTHEGIDTLLEMILLTAEVAELKANPNRKARGLVIEAELDKGKGPVATVLVQKGTLHVGDPVAAGSCYGKVRAMMDDKGRRVKEAGPSTPVEILGLSDVPNAGEIFMSMENEKEARSFAETFISEGREKLLEDTKTRMSLDDLFTQIQAGSLKELDIIVKADVQGSVEAVKQSLLKLSNDEVIVKIIHGGVGAINESDVILASASNAIIIGFNVRPDAMAKATAEHENVDIRLYRVIYDAIADVEAAMKGMLDPVFEEKVIGHAEVRQLFKASGVGTIAGSYVTDGVFQRNCLIRIHRGDEMVYEGSLASLKRFKDDVKEVKAGYECGLVFEKFNDIKEEDKVEAYIMVEVPR